MAKKLRWSQAYDNQPIRLPIKGRKALACCDCGLVHWFRAQVTNGRVFIYPERDDKETATVRKRMKGKA